MSTTTVKVSILNIFIFSYCFSQSSTLLVSDSVRTITTPTTIVLEATSAVAITALLFHYDQDIYNEIHGWRENNDVIGKMSPVITNMGNGLFSIGLFGGFTGYGLIFKDNKASDAGRIGIESFLLTGISVQFLKYLCGRERPSDATRPGGFWHGPFSYFDKQKRGTLGMAAFDSFPSGHTITAFAAAAVVSDFYTEPWVSYACYSLASMVAISRVMESTHWLSDCFVGAILGYYGTKIVEKLNYSSSRISLVPLANERCYGLLLSVKLYEQL